jgi:hypothetical protein
MGTLGLQRASEMLSFRHIITIAAWSDISVKRRLIFQGHSTAASKATKM